MKLILGLAIWVVAFCVGMGWLSWPWIGLCLVLGYMRGVMFAGSRIPSGDFREQTREEFDVTQKVVLYSTLFTLVPIGIWFGIGKLVSFLAS